jgi:hypothetical protein
MKNGTIRRLLIESLVRIQPGEPNKSTAYGKI